MVRLMRCKKLLGKHSSGESGAVMIVALVVLAVGSIIIPPTLSYIGTGTKATAVYADRTALVYAADAGVENATRSL